jgi:hypothetical protein
VIAGTQAILGDVPPNNELKDSLKLVAAVQSLLGTLALHEGKGSAAVSTLCVGSKR